MFVFAVWYVHLKAENEQNEKGEESTLKVLVNVPDSKGKSAAEYEWQNVDITAIQGLALLPISSILEK